MVDTAPESPGTTEHEEHWHPPYWRVFVILLVLTAIEMLLAFFPVRWIAISLMVIIAIAKILYIGRYFMHLKFDQKFLGAIACAPLLFASPMVFYLLLDFA